jgi:hypothetical protein
MIGLCHEILDGNGPTEKTLLPKTSPKSDSPSKALKTPVTRFGGK